MLAIKIHEIKKIKNNKIKKYSFSSDEDDKLRKLVKKYGDQKWSFIASKMENRNTRQCRERWTKYLSPLAVNGSWSPEEDNMLRLKFIEFGRKWKYFTMFFKGRTDINIRNRWKYLTKHNLTQIQQAPILLKQQISINNYCKDNNYCNGINYNDDNFYLYGNFDLNEDNFQNEYICSNNNDNNNNVNNNNANNNNANNNNANNNNANNNDVNNNDVNNNDVNNNDNTNDNTNNEKNENYDNRRNNKSNDKQIEISNNWNNQQINDLINLMAFEACLEMSYFTECEF